MALNYDKQDNIGYLTYKTTMLSATVGLDYESVNLENYTEIRDGIDLAFSNEEKFRPKIELRNLLYSSLVLLAGEANG